MDIICLDEFKGRVLVKFSISASAFGGRGEGFGIHVTDVSAISIITEKLILLSKNICFKILLFSF